METPSVIDSSWVIYTHVRDAVLKRKVDSVVLLVPSAPRRALSLLGLSSTSAVVSIYGEDSTETLKSPPQNQQNLQRSSSSISLSPSTPRVPSILVKIIDLSHSSFTNPDGFGDSKLIEALQPPVSLKTRGGSHLIAIEDIGALIQFSDTLAAASNLIQRIMHQGIVRNESLPIPSTNDVISNSATTNTTTQLSSSVLSSSSSSSSLTSSTTSSSKHVTVHITALCNPEADWAQSNNHEFSRKFGLGILESLALQAHYIVRVGPLPSGYSRDVHGRVSVEENAAVTSSLIPSTGSASSRPSYLGGSRSVLFRLSSDGKARAVGDVKFSSLQQQQQIGNSKTSRNSTNSTTFKEIPLSQDKFGEALVDD
jgi:hypothetical protein